MSLCIREYSIISKKACRYLSPVRINMEVRTEMAKLLMILGAGVFLIGLALFFIPKAPWLGQLPGDIDLKAKGFRIYFPIVTCILLSILLTILLNLFGLFRR